MSDMEGDRVIPHIGVSFRKTEVTEVVVNGQVESSLETAHMFVAPEIVTPDVAAVLVADGLDTLTKRRTALRNRSIRNCVINVLGSGGLAVGAGNEVYQSDSNLIRAAYALGAVVSTLWALGAAAEVVDSYYERGGDFQPLNVQIYMLENERQRLNDQAPSSSDQ